MKATIIYSGAIIAFLLSVSQGYFLWSVYFTFRNLVAVRDGGRRAVLFVAAAVSGAKTITDVIYHCHRVTTGDEDAYLCAWLVTDSIIGTALAGLHYHDTGEWYKRGEDNEDHVISHLRSKGVLNEIEVVSHWNPDFDSIGKREFSDDSSPRVCDHSGAIVSISLITLPLMRQHG